MLVLSLGIVSTTKQEDRVGGLVYFFSVKCEKFLNSTKAGTVVWELNLFYSKLPRYKNPGFLINSDWFQQIC